jgi:SAM-dependent methyltransferase
MKEQLPGIEFTGEFFVPGKSGERIEADHMERYKFACQFANGKSILDIASGTGYAAPLLVGNGALSYDGVDINPDLVRYSNAAYSSDNTRYHCGNICSFDHGRSYDLITCFETIEHVQDYEAAIDNLHRHLKPGGVLLVSSPNRPITSPHCRSLSDKPLNEFHTQEFVPEELLAVLSRHGFAAGRQNIFGQRQRWAAYSHNTLGKMLRAVFGNPDEVSSPTVTMVSAKVPRYFIIVAERPAA